MMSNSVPGWGLIVMGVALAAFIILVAAYVIRHHGFKRPLFASPYIVWILIFTVVPCLIVAYYSFTHTVEKEYENEGDISAEASYTVTVEKACVTVYAENKSMTAGGEMPELTVAVTGYTFGSKQGVKSLIKQYKPVCTPGTEPGEYVIGFENDMVSTRDYDIVFKSGTMTVAPQGETVIAVRDYEKTFDKQELSPSACCSDRDAVLEYSTDEGKSWNEKAPAITDAGMLNVTVRAVKDGKEAARARYTLKVEQAPVTVKVLNISGIAGEKIPEYRAILLGMTYDKKDDQKIVYTLDANPGTKPGMYEVYALGEEDQGNYRVSFENGSLYLAEPDEIAFAATDVVCTYNGRKTVPTDFVFINTTTVNPVQSMETVDTATGESTPFTDLNIEHPGVYRVKNSVVQNTYLAKEFTFDNFAAFWDSNYIARQKLQKINAQQDGKSSAGTLDERGRVHVDIFVFSLWMAFLCTVFCLLLGYPAAYIMADREFRLGSTIVILFIVPMWMNFLLRTIAMMALLNDDGVINTLLTSLGLDKLQLINNAGAVQLGMVYNFLPFMVFPIYNVLNKMDIRLSEAAMDLGCNKFQTFVKVTLPLSVPGVVSGITMVFMPAVTTFYISGLLGGGKVTMFGDLIESKFISTSLESWNEGSALSLIMMILILISIGLLRKADPKGEGGGAV